MAVVSKPKQIEGEYGYAGKYSYATNNHSIGLLEVEAINKIVRSKWGWHFIPTDTANYHNQYSDDWYKHQRCILTFDSKEDLVQAILEVGNRL